jgi:hypothetical protein
MCQKQEADSDYFLIFKPAGKPMRAILLNELNTEEINKINGYLKNIAEPTALEDIFWLILPENVLSKKQKDLCGEKGPYKIPVEVSRDSVTFELIVRADMIHNEGGGPVTIKQLLYIYKIINTMTAELNLITCG